MPLGRTDGATEPVDQDSGWDAVFAEGAAFGDDAAQSLTADLGTSPPQTGQDGSSASGDAGQSAPHGSAPGEDAPPAAQGPAGDPTTPDPLDVDPLAGAEPFTYPGVDGAPVTIEGAYRLPGDGLYVPEDKVPQFQEIATRAATLERQHRDLTERSQTFDRQTTWQTRDAQGNVQTITGAPALQAQREALARTVAFNREFAKITSGDVDPRDAIGVDAEGNVFWRKDWIDGLNARGSFEADKAAFAVARHFEQLGVAPPPPEPPASSYAASSIEQYAKDHTITGLTAQDKQYLAGQFEFYVQRTQTGSVVNPKFLDVMKERAEQRAALVRAATTSATTTTFNRGMDKGRQAATPARPAVTPPPALVGRHAPRARTEPSPNDVWSRLTAEAMEGI